MTPIGWNFAWIFVTPVPRRMTAGDAADDVLAPDRIRDPPALLILIRQPNEELCKQGRSEKRQYLHGTLVLFNPQHQLPLRQRHRSDPGMKDLRLHGAPLLTGVAFLLAIDSRRSRENRHRPPMFARWYTTRHRRPDIPRPRSALLPVQTSPWVCASRVRPLSGCGRAGRNSA